jgi:hypothetical protein
MRLGHGLARRRVYCLTLGTVAKVLDGGNLGALFFLRLSLGNEPGILG